MANLNFRFQPENIRKNIVTIGSSLKLLILEIFVKKVFKANLNFRYQPEKIRKNMGTIGPSLKLKSNSAINFQICHLLVTTIGNFS